MKGLLILLLLLCCTNALVKAQQDSVVSTQDSLVAASQDTTLLKSYAKRYNPKRSLLLAAVVPGLGQIYNKKYWKVPLVYGGLFATGYAVSYYNGLYKDYKAILFRALENDVGETDPPDPDLGMETTVRGYRTAVDKAKRERDFMLVIMGLVYVLQIVDAHVDSHLKEFDLNPRLQVSIEPMMEQNYLTGRQTGASLVLRF